jgi:hypothetical protein
MPSDIPDVPTGWVAIAEVRQVIRLGSLGVAADAHADTGAFRAPSIRALDAG